MPTTIQITTDNYDGQTAVITYYPDTGGTINLGSHVLPYDYNADYYYGTYSLYFPEFDTTCTLVIANQTPTPTPTNTPTPTLTPTPTPTPTQQPSKQYYVYKLCGDAKVAYVVQTQPGLTTTPGKVIRTTIDEYCWEFLYQTTNPNPIPPAPFVQIVEWDGDYLTPSLGIIFDNCTDCLSYVTPLPPTTYVLLGPYASDTLACVAGNQNGIGGLGFTTISNNNTLVGSQVYNTPLFGTTQLVTTPGWYSITPSFTGAGIYNTIYINNTGTITQTGQICISVVIP
jgi:hypothetical protein